MFKSTFDKYFELPEEQRRAGEYPTASLLLMLDEGFEGNMCLLNGPFQRQKKEIVTSIRQFYTCILRFGLVSEMMY